MVNMDWNALFKASKMENLGAVPEVKQPNPWNPKNWKIEEFGALASILGVGWLLYKDLSKKK